MEEPTTDEEQRDAEARARIVARAKPLSKEKRQQIASLLAQPRRRGAA